MEKEVIFRESSDKDAWICICGNRPIDDGFYPCDENGSQVEPTTAEWPTDLSVCARCGRMVNPDSLEVVGRGKQPQL